MQRWAGTRRSVAGTGATEHLRRGRVGAYLPLERRAGWVRVYLESGLVIFEHLTRA